jgi:hypothetical protein
MIMFTLIPRLAYFAMLGFLGILLVGPVLAVGGALLGVALSMVLTLLPFAIIGLLVCGILRAGGFMKNALKGRRIPVTHALHTAVRSAKTAATHGRQAGARVLPALRCAGNGLKTAALAPVRAGTPVILEMVCGAGLAALLWVLAGAGPEVAVDESVLLAAAVGAIVGLVVGWSQKPSTRCASVTA